MSATAAEVLVGEARWSVEQADALTWLDSLPADSVDMLIASPPYASARLYLENGQDLGIARDAETWAEWMVEVTLAALRVCRGPIFWVVEGQTLDYSWDAAPMLLAADLVRRGVCLRRPCYYRRVGIPGSGGPDYFRCDAELVLCATRGGRLPWSDPTACGHPPRWAPGGAMSNRLANGARVNQWGMNVAKDGSLTATSRGGDGVTEKEQRLRRPRKPSHTVNSPTDAPGQLGLDGQPVAETRKESDPFHLKATNRPGRERDGCAKKGKKTITRKRSGQHSGQSTSYDLPVLANPGNVVGETYTAAEVDALLGQMGEFVDCTVGGGQMGSALAHDNEAPFPETLVERFVRSFCPPGGIVADCFSGSGSTAAVALAWGRRTIACDLRQSQVDLTVRRLMGETPSLPGVE